MSGNDLADNKLWIVFERILSLITILVLAFAVWNTLLQVQMEQAKQSKAINATLEKINQQMQDKQEWEKVPKSLRSNLPR